MTNLSFGRPAAVAYISGGRQVPELSGTVYFYPCGCDVLVAAEICGLPQDEAHGGFGVFGFHIHEGRCCTGEDFADTGGHLNLCNQPHPYHTGDLPPLFSCGGSAFLAVRTGRFRICDIIGHTVVIHDHPDDFTTQPAGNSGTKIGCGMIRRF